MQEPTAQRPAVESTTDALANEVYPSAQETFQRAVRLMRAKQFSQAAQLLESIPNGEQRYPGLLLNLGIAYEQLGQYERAESALQRLLERKPNDAVAYNQLGIVNRKRGHFRQAREAYERALGLRPDYRLAHLNLGILCDLYLQSADCALRHYREYQKLSTVDDPRVSLWIEDLEKRTTPR